MFITFKAEITSPTFAGNTTGFLGNFGQLEKFVQMACGTA
jgi:hypothetical protein